LERAEAKSGRPAWRKKRRGGGGEGGGKFKYTSKKIDPHPLMKTSPIEAIVDLAASDIKGKRARKKGGGRVKLREGERGVLSGLTTD